LPNQSSSSSFHDHWPDKVGALFLFAVGSVKIQPAPHMSKTQVRTIIGMLIAVHLAAALLLSPMGLTVSDSPFSH
jgi:NADH:ubiquinone oxidoreductase subunit 6 (subunit J)